MSLLAWHWILVGASVVFAAIFFGNGRDKSLTLLVWAFMIALSTLDVVILLNAPRPAPTSLVARIAVVWGLLPPAYFYVEWYSVEAERRRRIARRELRLVQVTQDMGARVWGAIGIVLILLAQLALSKPHA